MSTTTTQDNTVNNNATDKVNEGKTMTDNVDTQAGKNTSYTAFRTCVDGIIKNFKADNQELEMIVAMVSIQDVLSLDNLVTLIKGDKLLYTPKERANASKSSKAKPVTPSAANQQRGALLALLPHYADLVAAKERGIASVDTELKAALKAAKAGRKLTEKQTKALMEGAKTSTVKKNAAKGEAELKIEAIESMFKRAIHKLYLLRRVSADNVVLNVKQKTITYDGFDFEKSGDTGNMKIKLFATKGEYTKTLAELSRDCNDFLKLDGVTAVRSNGKGANNRTPSPTPNKTATPPLNPIDTAANNANELGKMVRSITKDKDATKLAAFKKNAKAKALFDDMLQALFVTGNVLDVKALELAINVAVGKAHIGKQVLVAYSNDVPQTAKPKKEKVLPSGRAG